MSKYVEQLPLKSPAEMTDLYQLSFDEILDVLGALGDALDFDSNVHLQQAYEASLVANVLPAEMLKNSYRVLQPLFTRENVTRGRRQSGRAGLPQRMGAAPTCSTAANCGCAHSAPGCCTSPPAMAAWCRR